MEGVVGVGIGRDPGQVVHRGLSHYGFRRAVHVARRHRIPKVRYDVPNCRKLQEYDGGLKQRGDLALWLEEVATA
jgi:hypothetical protein